MKNRDKTYVDISVFRFKKEGEAVNFYKVSNDYINFIHTVDHHCINSSNMIGIILRFHEHIYFLPVDGKDSNDYDANGEVRASTPSILRMLDMNMKEILENVYFLICFPYHLLALLLFSQCF